jgi:hypothetical protein
LRTRNRRRNDRTSSNDSRCDDRRGNDNRCNKNEANNAAADEEDVQTKSGCFAVVVSCDDDTPNLPRQSEF